MKKQGKIIQSLFLKWWRIGNCSSSSHLKPILKDEIPHDNVTNHISCLYYPFSRKSTMQVYNIFIRKKKNPQSHLVNAPRMLPLALTLHSQNHSISNHLLNLFKINPINSQPMIFPWVHKLSSHFFNMSSNAFHNRDEPAFF